METLGSVIRDAIHEVLSEYEFVRKAHDSSEESARVEGEFYEEGDLESDDEGGADAKGVEEVRVTATGEA